MTFNDKTVLPEKHRFVVMSTSTDNTESSFLAVLRVRAGTGWPGASIL